jgi:hypothetical protein
VGHVGLAQSDESLAESTSPTPTLGALDRPPDGPEARPNLKGRGTSEPERTCILTREAAPQQRLIRLALGPDGIVMPDIRAKAPGRGAYIAVDRTALEKAQGNGKLKGALARAFKQPVSAPDDLGARIEAALRKAALDRLGLEARSGALLTGSEKIDVALRKGEVHLLLHASDAGADGNRKLDQAWRVGGAEGQGLVFPEERAILSLALGRQNVVHAALIDRAAAQRVRHALERWRAFAGETDGVGAVVAGTPDAPADVVNEGQYERYD